MRVSHAYRVFHVGSGFAYNRGFSCWLGFFVEIRVLHVGRVFHVRQGLPCRLWFFMLIGVSRAVAGFPVTSCAPTPHAAASRLCRHSAQTHTPEKCVCVVSCFILSTVFLLALFRNVCSQTNLEAIVWKFRRDFTFHSC